MIYRRQTKADADELVALRDTLTPDPVRGVHVGGGRHVDMPAEWDRGGDVPPGWSGFPGAREEFADIEDDATTVGYRVDFPEDMQELLDASDMHPSDRVTMQTAIDGADDPTAENQPQTRPRGWQRKEVEE